MRELCSRETDRETAACFADYTQRKICDFLHWMQYPAVPRWAQGVGGAGPKNRGQAPKFSRTLDTLWSIYFQKKTG